MFTKALIKDIAGILSQQTWRQTIQTNKNNIESGGLTIEATDTENKATILAISLSPILVV